MNNILSTAASGLRAQATRLHISAHNVANLLTDGFRPLRIDLQARPGGGVWAVVSETSSTDLVFEAITRISASRAYEANVAVLRSEQDRAEMLLALKPL